MKRHTKVQLAGWIFILAGALNVAACFASKNALYAAAGGALFVAAITFFISARTLRKNADSDSAPE